eukprot:CAMPEP_0185849428 /NCGR_PEP_ID=MMETSP1354-20130828/3929_1 /TAXON_ID=708628 /ORGANISM="Erythrolobus madagascarensis, Strain CCMP3276" /LENGTH=459 /DNA_ID=CAMNT_0028549945 /DNA_START=254 /DNA_END=1633 /DNA_ORIENTATION=+
MEVGWGGRDGLSRRKASWITSLPEIRAVNNDDRVPLLIRKMKMCEAKYDFSSPRIDAAQKEGKRKTLVEIVEYMSSDRSSNLFADSRIYAPLCSMVAANLFRALTICEGDEEDLYDPEDGEPLMEPDWSHVSLVYEVLRRFVTASELNTKLARKVIDQRFVLGLFDLFHSEDPRERECLKTIVHRIYGRFVPMRSFIRRTIQHVFHHYIYSDDAHSSGVAELLEILGSVINGFSVPLKPDHREFLLRALIPLHSAVALTKYYPQLSFCVSQFLEKEPQLAESVLLGLLKYWPVTHSRKEVMFLNELEDVLEVTQQPEFDLVARALFLRLGKCIGSAHFQVSERALLLFNNECFVQMMLDSDVQVVPLIANGLRTAGEHWNENVVALSENVKELLWDVVPGEVVEKELGERTQRKRLDENEGGSRGGSQRRIQCEMMWNNVLWTSSECSPSGHEERKEWQ